MKIKTSELTGAAFDWAVAKVLGYEVRAHRDKYFPHDLSLADAHSKTVMICGPWRPSVNWAQGGPIIERERLILRPCFDGGWECAANPSVWRAGPTPLIAAMRCYAASKLGNEVDVPEDLT